MQIRVIVESTKNMELTNVIHKKEDIYKFNSMDAAYKHFFDMCIDACIDLDMDDISTDITLWDSDNELVEYFTINENGISNNMK